ncbi:hypothetical protein OAT67_02235 [Bacteriovoracaceae bacterium]|nr:hypothetical protein [Bacteriovoracaceae bacterium]
MKKIAILFFTLISLQVSAKNYAIGAGYLSSPPVGANDKSSPVLKHETESGLTLDFLKFLDEYIIGVGYISTKSKYHMSNSEYSYDISMATASFGYSFEIDEKLSFDLLGLVLYGKNKFKSSSNTVIKSSTNFGYGVGAVLTHELVKYDENNTSIDGYFGVKLININADNFEYNNEIFHGDKFEKHYNLVLGFKYGF